MDYTSLLIIINIASLPLWVCLLVDRKTMNERIFDLEKMLREDIKILKQFHREDIERLDAKWERLFERLLLQDQQRTS